MTRQADPKSKTATVIIKANTEDEDKQIRALKELCVRNNLEIRKVLMQKINDFLKEHNWPPGNSQTILPVFGVDSKKICGLCGKEAEHLYDCLFISGLQKWVCKDCKNNARERTTLRHVYEMR